MKKFLILEYIIIKDGKLIGRILWNIFYTKYHTNVNSPFQAFCLYDKKECNVFINWLELYSFSVEQTKTYNSSIFNDNINNNLKILARPPRGYFLLLICLV